VRLTDERDVRTVERGDDADVTPLLPEHLARNPRTRRVRNRVMHVEQRQALFLNDLVHPHREREVVRWVLEQRVVADIHFVEVDARQVFREPEWRAIGDEVDFPPARRERDTELGRDST
jgi:hypothetical protein